MGMSSSGGAGGASVVPFKGQMPVNRMQPINNGMPMPQQPMGQDPRQQPVFNQQPLPGDPAIQGFPSRPQPNFNQQPLPGQQNQFPPPGLLGGMGGQMPPSRGQPGNPFTTLPAPQPQTIPPTRNPGNPITTFPAPPAQNIPPMRNPGNPITTFPAPGASMNGVKNPGRGFVNQGRPVFSNRV